MKILFIGLVLSAFVFNPFQAHATLPYKTATCDPANPSHIPAAEAWRRASANTQGNDFPCWVYIAAMQGHAEAEMKEGALLMANKLWGEALDWCLKSASQGNATAAWNLSELYRTGKGTPKDLAKAQYWRAIAIKDPVVRANAGLPADAETSRDAPPPAATADCNPTNARSIPASEYKAGIKKALAERNAPEGICWTYVGAMQGDASTEGNYGEMLLQGIGMQMNVNAAFDWSKKSADQGNLRAALVVAYMYSQGLGIPRDMTKANLWMAKASQDPRIRTYIVASTPATRTGKSDAQTVNDAVAQFLDEYIEAPMRRGEVGKAMANMDVLTTPGPMLPCSQEEKEEAVNRSGKNCAERQRRYDAWEASQAAHPLQR